MKKIVICPTCGKRSIKAVCRDVEGTWLGKPFVAPKVAFYECSNCGERLYDHAAMQQIQSHYPKRSQAGRRRKAS